MMTGHTASRTAVVVGGGIGGLAAAIALHRTGWRVTVLEAAPHFGEVGAGISLWANALQALSVLGLAEQVRGAGQAEHPGGLRTHRGRWLIRVDGATLGRVLGAAGTGIHRAALHGVLRDALPAESLVNDATVVDVTAGPPATVTYRRAGADTTRSADLLVGADGIRSIVRARQWPGQPPPSYVGATAWRGVTAAPWQGPLPVAGSWGPGSEFGMLPLRDGRVYWYGAINAPEGQRSADEWAAVAQHFGGWHPPIPQLLAATEPASVLRHDLYHLAMPLPSYVDGAVALLGDAAHAMTPYLGQGACQALEDAAVLGVVCAAAAPAEVPAALARYDRLRRPRSQQVARASLLAGRFGQLLTNPVGRAVRDTVTWLTPARLMMRGMTRYVQWQPPQQ